MASTMFQSESAWLSQMDEMREALATLKLADKSSSTFIYGSDLGLDEDSEDSLEDDIWDVDGDDAESPESDDNYDLPSQDVSGVYDRSWLHRRCFDLANSRTGMSGHDLEQQIIALLSSDSSNDELQISLAEIIGFDNLDFVIDLISNRQQIISSPSATMQQTDGLFDRLQTREEREATLRQQDYEHKNAQLAPAYDRSGPKYPHVYQSSSAATGTKLDVNGKRFGLPLGATRNDQQKYEEVSIPAAKVGSLAIGQKLVKISEMDGLCQRTFKGYQNLNRMQSLLYHVAYETSENMLICAPTGAGKTDAAMLTILNAIAKNVEPSPVESPDALDFVVMADDFKIVYVAPMKALAAEVTEKLGKRLAWLGIVVRELTGDMQLTKKEIAATQIIVTTPEKWDVVTRKSTGDTELVQKVRLLIIDEVSSTSVI